MAILVSATPVNAVDLACYEWSSLMYHVVKGILYSVGGKLVRAVDAWETAPSFLVFRRASRCFITAYEFTVPENLEIQRNLQHKNFAWALPLRSRIGIQKQLANEMSV
ncbi:hypothetical protein Y032_0043g890 [Ancylostoma ceylanicum]|uniref:Uncharacterized protein n=1 Tax=Ancylostoma ceylanicum TaxID=53326 RepID=A0A016UFN5_9BILA|nr:hypothetical protein Y032_0043g890 [Ancylostoma ceylanicum]